VAAGLAIELETERPEQLLEIAESNVAAAANDALPLSWRASSRGLYLATG
jgi:hypothetical protein